MGDIPFEKVPEFLKGAMVFWFGSSFSEKALILVFLIILFWIWCYAKHMYPLVIEDRKNQREFLERAEKSRKELEREVERRSVKRLTKGKTDD